MENQKCEKCGGDMWAMTRLIEPPRMIKKTIPRIDREVTVRESEIYGKVCGSCRAEVLFENPVPETEIAWKDAGDGRRVVA